jgi:hypothetical protein
MNWLFHTIEIQRWHLAVIFIYVLITHIYLTVRIFQLKKPQSKYNIRINQANNSSSIKANTEQINEYQRKNKHRTRPHQSVTPDIALCHRQIPENVPSKANQKDENAAECFHADKSSTGEESSQPKENLTVNFGSVRFWLILNSLKEASVLMSLRGAQRRSNPESPFTVRDCFVLPRRTRNDNCQPKENGNVNFG